MENDLISRSKLMKILKEAHDGIRQIYYSLIDYVDKAICKGELGTYARVKRIVEEAPVVDAVEVVRCRDCEYFEDEECVCPYIFMSDGARMYPDRDDFCSYGERREENAVD